MPVLQFFQHSNTTVISLDYKNFSLKWYQDDVVELFHPLIYFLLNQSYSSVGKSVRIVDGNVLLSSYFVNPQPWSRPLKVVQNGGGPSIYRHGRCKTKQKKMNGWKVCMLCPKFFFFFFSMQDKQTARWTPLITYVYKFLISIKNIKNLMYLDSDHLEMYEHSKQKMIY